MVGQWVARTDPWYDQRPVYCALTGQLIPGRSWVAEVEGQVLAFSDPGSERLYRRHVLGERISATDDAPAAHDRRDEP